MDEAPSSLALSPSPSISRARSLPRSLPPLPPYLTLSRSPRSLFWFISLRHLVLLPFPLFFSFASLALSLQILLFFFLPLFSFVSIPPLFALQMLGELSAI